MLLYIYSHNNKKKQKKGESHLFPFFFLDQHLNSISPVLSPMQIQDVNRKLHALAALLHLAQGGAIQYLTSKDPGNGKKWPIYNSVFGTERKIGEYNLGTLLPIFPYMSSLNHILSYTSESPDADSSLFRTVEYSFSASVMTWLIANLSGVVDIKTLVTLCLLNVMMQYCGLRVERSLSDQNRGEASRYLGLGFLLHFTMWFILISSFSSSLDAVKEAQSGTEIPSVVRYIIWVMFLLFTSFGVVCSLQYGNVLDRDMAERAYIILSMVSKSVLTWMVYFGVIKGASADDFPPSANSSETFRGRVPG